MGCVLQTPALKVQGSMQRGQIERAERVDESKETASCRYNRRDDNTNSQICASIHVTCKPSKQTKAQHTEGNGQNLLCRFLRCTSALRQDLGTMILHRLLGRQSRSPLREPVPKCTASPFPKLPSLINSLTQRLSPSFHSSTLEI